MSVMNRAFVKASGYILIFSSLFFNPKVYQKNWQFLENNVKISATSLGHFADKKKKASILN
jgi:hypothetical protein